MKCQICCGNRLYKFLSLGHQPFAGNFLTSKQLDEPEIFYPLDVYFCPDCGLVQIGYIADPNILFRDYAYNTATNEGLRINFRKLVSSLIQKFNLTQKDLAIDIGSNDGTLLEGYTPHNIKMLGIEPSNISELSIKKGIPTINDFFNQNLAQSILEEYGKAKIITSTNVFAHVRDLSSFVMGVSKILSHEGVFVSESHYLLDLLSKLQYDSIYHEHLRCYSLKPLMHLFSQHGMDVFDAEHIESHGGSIRVYSCIKGAYPISENVKKLVALEEQEGIYKKNTYDEFRSKVISSKYSLQDILRKIKLEGSGIAGIGAPTKGNTLLNYCDIGPEILDYIAEKSELKIGKFTPGMHIPVVNESQLLAKQPEYALLLSWNLKDILIPKLREIGFKGKFIIPNPVPQVIQSARWNIKT